MVDLAIKLDKHLIPDLANIVLEYCQLEHVDEVVNGCRRIYTMLFDKRHGEFKFYYPSGELMYSCHWINDKLHGKYKGYYLTGGMLSSKHYVNDKLHGECNGYNRDGELWYSHHYVNGYIKQ